MYTPPKTARDNTSAECTEVVYVSTHEALYEFTRVLGDYATGRHLKSVTDIKFVADYENRSLYVNERALNILFKHYRNSLDAKLDQKDEEDD